MMSDIDKMIDNIRRAAPPGHRIHTADTADLRIAVTHVCDVIAAYMESDMEPDEQDD
jgi:hypothetical protein